MNPFENANKRVACYRKITKSTGLTFYLSVGAMPLISFSLGRSLALDLLKILRPLSMPFLFSFCTSSGK